MERSRATDKNFLYIVKRSWRHENKFETSKLTVRTPGGLGDPERLFSPLNNKKDKMNLTFLKQIGLKSTLPTKLMNDNRTTAQFVTPAPSPNPPRTLFGLFFDGFGE